jgi:hypothetical protein
LNQLPEVAKNDFLHPIGDDFGGLGKAGLKAAKTLIE